ncbi:LysR family transcriptional regulator [Brevundimonas sp. G8]|uniref:LysR family transcriptional regulator n=1 Tax=Brevundimonas sp. G8 TaxID=1350776 RepID=UPI0012F3BDCC|nr:LysR family transcriptional regulator [Brevundimonas sp. G8]VXB72458.1 Putative transcriptional regulator [Brevundimonas sp. G8]
MDRDTWNDLAVFAAIVEAGSFTKAGVALGVTASALSHRMRLMEARMGLRLLNRTTRSVAPTEAGDRLLASLRPAIAEVTDALVALNADRAKPAGRVRVTAHRSAAFGLVLPRLRGLAEVYPEITVELVVDDGLVDIVKGGFDAGIRRLPSLEQDMVSVRLDDGVRIIMVASPAYLDAAGVPMSPTDLERHRCLNYRLPTAGSIYRWTFERDGQTTTMDVPGGFVTNDIDMLCEGAMAGLGVACVIETQAAPWLASGALISVLDDWRPQLPSNYLYYAGHRNLPPALRVFIDAMKTAAPG